eukprot:8974773-Lingulodinium_polyedra.AAC.1
MTSPGAPSRRRASSPPSGVSCPQHSSTDARSSTGTVATKSTATNPHKPPSGSRDTGLNTASGHRELMTPA